MNPATLFVGLDIAQRTIDVCALTLSGEKVDKPKTFKNTLDGANSLSSYLIDILSKQNLTGLIIGMEATGVLWWHIYNFLLEDLPLAPYLTFNEKLKPQVYTFNPKLIHNFKKIFNEQSKTDKIDAYMIANRLRFGELPKNNFADETYEALKRLTRYRFHLMSNICREKNYFLTMLFLKYSAFSQQNPFSDPFGASASSVITDFFSIDEIASTSIEELTDFLIEKGKNRFKNPQNIAGELKKIAKNSYRLKPSLKEPVNIILENSLTTIRALQAQVKTIDKAIEKEIGKISQPLTSIKGIGNVLAAGIIAEVGDISNFDKEPKFAKYIGLSWKENQSGDFKAEDTKSVKASNKYLKYYMVEAANCLRNHNDIYKSYYWKKFNETKTHKHKRALVLTARKFTRLVYSMLKKNQLYSEHL